MDAEYVKQYNCTLLSGYVFTNVKPERGRYVLQDMNGQTLSRLFRK